MGKPKVPLPPQPPQAAPQGVTLLERVERLEKAVNVLAGFAYAASPYTAKKTREALKG